MQRTLAIANYFIKKSNYTVTPLQLIKIVYISYGYVLAILEEKLFSEEIEAWQFGPVVPSIYHTFKHYKKESVSELSTEITFDDNFHFNEEIFTMDKENENYETTIQILDKVWDSYKKYSGYELIDLTHKDNTPWSQVFKHNQHHIKLEDSAIKTYYSKLLAK
jgi:uncharacterized phage-associated protein